MSFNALPTLATGDAWTAANANTYWKDNFADHESRLLVAEAAAVPAGRQGGNASEWASPGSSNYTPAGSKIQVGSFTQTIPVNTTDVYTDITYPEAFAHTPVVFCSVQPDYYLAALKGAFVEYEESTKTKARIHLMFNSNHGYQLDFVIHWMAIGD